MASLVRRVGDGLAVVMVLDAVLFMVLGTELFADALGVLSWYGMLPAGLVRGTAVDFTQDFTLSLPVKLVAQVLGMVLASMGVLILGVRRLLIQAGGAGRALVCAATLAAIHLSIAVGLLVTVVQYPSPLGWASTIGMTALASAYAVSAVLRQKPDPPPTGPARKVALTVVDVNRAA